MIEPALLLLVFGAGLVAGAVNVMAGGGSLLTLPVLLFLGLPAALANGTNRIGILAQNVVAAADFKRAGVGDLGTGVRLALATLPGAILGAVVAIEIPERVFRLILALVLVFAVAALLIPSAVGADSGAAPRRPGWLTYVAFGAIGFYGGFIQAGIGFVFLAVLHRLLRLDLVRANMYKVTVIGVYTIPALAVFIATGNVAWVVGLVLGAGTAVGALAATRISIAGGEKPVRIVVGLALAAMAVRLVWQ